MKKLFFTALVAVSTSISAFAVDVKQVDQKAVQSFETSFTDASDVNWTSTDLFTKANFIQDDKSFAAYYNQDGDFVGTTSSLNLKEVPAYVRRMVREEYKGYRVKEALEFVGAEESAYFISVENGGESVILKVEDGYISVYADNAKAGKNSLGI